ncbi:hypothetical protein [Bacteroides pyogenes]|uniref:hypothetical protein n=1 Tax=Bacteroides pyogenes TaxID=310300 RepID=UPI0020115C17|nr:hypothetical protein [Bacteroides pyogenes]MBR8726011.1 hypothetical protein [Bacteroides pyogenes]MBR8739291.1 hypothetical protein [Bacteroides pyogenes]MBR8755159.1 hypothetical protein [Bacteroides pyogenes]MBR8796505.1 hypothetical protein [Bacteroides pyogenes]MBR8810005.1 hypothetical protein [Bacteroides pyogenes]
MNEAITVNDLSLGQKISAKVWFRFGRFGEEKDFARIEGKVIGKMECYNSVLVEVDMERSYNAPNKHMWVDLDKIKLITTTN